MWRGWLNGKCYQNLPEEIENKLKICLIHEKSKIINDFKKIIKMINDELVWFSGCTEDLEVLRLHRMWIKWRSGKQHKKLPQEIQVQLEECKNVLATKIKNKTKPGSEPFS